jgi:hypothetical protein
MRSRNVSAGLVKGERRYLPVDGSKAMTANSHFENARRKAGLQSNMRFC